MLPRTRNTSDNERLPSSVLRDPYGRRTTEYGRRMLTLTWHGHACFTIEAAGRRVIIDPFLTGNPAADIGFDKLPKIDAVLLSRSEERRVGKEGRARWSP